MTSTSTPIKAHRPGLMWACILGGAALLGVRFAFGTPLAAMGGWLLLIYGVGQWVSARAAAQLRANALSAAANDRPSLKSLRATAGELDRAQSLLELGALPESLDALRKVQAAAREDLEEPLVDLIAGCLAAPRDDDERRIASTVQLASLILAAELVDLAIDHLQFPETQPDPPDVVLAEARQHAARGQADDLAERIDALTADRAGWSAEAFQSLEDALFDRADQATPEPGSAPAARSLAP